MKLRLWIFLLVLVLLSAVWWYFSGHLRLPVLIEQEDRLRESVERSPVVSFIVGFLIYTAASLVPGTGGKAIVCGWLFGFWSALLLVNGALSVAALITFLIVRYIFYDWVHRRFTAVVRRVDEALQRDGAFYLIMLRLVHAPYTLTNYAAGATDVPARTFWWTTQLGLIPGNAAFVLAGSRLPTLEQLAREGVWGLFDLPLWIALTVPALIPLAARWIIRRLRRNGSELYQDDLEQSALAAEKDTKP